MKTLEQERMAKAYECVEEAIDGGLAKEYKSLAQKLPSMITHNGLLTTLAFLKSKSKRDKKDGKGKVNAPNLLLEQILSYLNYRFQLQAEEYGELMKKFKNGEFNMGEYLYMSKEVVEFAVWLKRIAEGEIEDEGTD